MPFQVKVEDLEPLRTLVKDNDVESIKFINDNPECSLMVLVEQITDYKNPPELFNVKVLAHGALQRAILLAATPDEPRADDVIAKLVSACATALECLLWNDPEPDSRNGRAAKEVQDAIELSKRYKGV